MSAIERSKQINLDKLVVGFGIRNIGDKAAALLAEHFGTLQALREATVEKISEIDDYRARYYKHHTGHDWYDARNYDLSLNSGVLGFDGTVEELIKYMEVREQFQK